MSQRTVLAKTGTSIGNLHQRFEVLWRTEVVVRREAEIEREFAVRRGRRIDRGRKRCHRNGGNAPQGGIE